MWRLCSFLGPCIHSSLEFNVLETFRLWKTSKEETRVVFHQVLQIVGPFLFQSWLFSLSLTLFFFSCHHLKHCLILELLLFSRTLGIFDGQINQLYIGNKKHWFVYTDNTFYLKCWGRNSSHPYGDVNLLLDSFSLHQISALLWCWKLNLPSSGHSKVHTLLYLPHM